jgi:hypothetical protein
VAKLISDWILKNKFSRFGHKVLIRNETSHTVLLKSNLITIRELRENSLSLEIPKDPCQKGHNLTIFLLNIHTKSPSILPPGHLKEATFEAMSKVISIEKGTDKENTIIIEALFTQYEIVEWKKILSSYEKNQENINNIIMGTHAVKDEE